MYMDRHACSSQIRTPFLLRLRLRLTRLTDDVALCTRRMAGKVVVGASPRRTAAGGADGGAPPPATGTGTEEAVAANTPTPTDGDGRGAGAAAAPAERLRRAGLPARAPQPLAQRGGIRRGCLAAWRPITAARSSALRREKSAPYPSTRRYAGYGRAGPAERERAAAPLLGSRSAAGGDVPAAGHRSDPSAGSAAPPTPQTPAPSPSTSQVDSWSSSSQGLGS
eukprot:gene16810-54566_t